MRSDSEATVRVLGNLNCDLILANVEALPEWGREVVGTSRRVEVAGQAGYIALALRALGMTVNLSGAVGDDSDGAWILESFRNAGVDVSDARVLPGRTGLTIALVRPDGERAFVSDFGVSADVTTTMFETALDRPAAFTIVAGTSNLQALSGPDFLSLIERLATGSVLLFDPGWAPGGYDERTRSEVIQALQFVDLYVPNEVEAMSVSGASDPESALHRLSEFVRGRVIVKCGPRGALGLNDYGELLAVDARPVIAYDAVGAGDVFDAALVTGLSRGHDAASATTLAAEAATRFVERSTDRFPTSLTAPKEET